MNNYCQFISVLSIYKFLAKNTSILTLLGLSELWGFEIIFLEVLKTRSDAALDALMHRYFLAKSERVGYDDE